MTSSKITQDILLLDGRRSVCEEWTDDEGNVLHVSYTCPAKTDIHAVKSARATKVAVESTAVRAQVAEAKLAEAPKEELVMAEPVEETL